jgi:hypothetical protein
VAVNAEFELDSVAYLPGFTLVEDWPGFPTGTYDQIAQHAMTVTETFDHPYDDVPIVWPRQHETVGVCFLPFGVTESWWQYIPYARVLSVSETGVTFRTYIYSMRHQATGEVYWWPGVEQQVQCAYTAVGRPASASVGDAGRRVNVLRCGPVPARREVRISCALAAPGDAEIGVFDISGARIASVFSGRLASGDHEFTWTGLREGGAACKPGVYFVRLRTDRVAKTDRIVLLR